MRQIALLLLLLTSRANATVLFSCVPSAPVGTSATAFTAPEDYWVIVSAGTSINTVQNSAWGVAIEQTGANATYAHLSNTKTAYSDVTVSVKVTAGTSQMFFGFRNNPGWTLQGGMGGYINNGGYAFRVIANTWYLQKSNGTALSAIATGTTSAISAGDVITFGATGANLWAAKNGTSMVSASDASYTSGGFSFGGYSTGTNYFGLITVDDGAVAPVIGTSLFQVFPMYYVGNH